MNGFSFGGNHSDSFGIIVNKKKIPLTPPIENRFQSIGGFDGAWDYGATFGAREIEVDVTLFGDTKEEMKANARRLAGKLNPRLGAKTLIFDDEPDKQYFARLSNQIPLEQLGAMGTFTIQFVCPDPFTYSVILNTFTFTSSKVIDHLGSHEGRPVLTITKNAGAATIVNTRNDDVIETITFTSDSPSGIYVIDCKESTITKSGDAAYNYVSGDFFTLIEGDNTIQNSGAITSVTIEYRDTWL
jgi:predicted phage tail component-like protein